MNVGMGVPISGKFLFCLSPYNDLAITNTRLIMCFLKATLLLSNYILDIYSLTAPKQSIRRNSRFLVLNLIRPSWCVRCMSLSLIKQQVVFYCLQCWAASAHMLSQSTSSQEQGSRTGRSYSCS